MQYKDQFICEGTEGYVLETLPHKKKESGWRLGEMLAEQLGHTSFITPDGQKVYSLEIIAYPAKQFNAAMKNLQEKLPLLEWEIVCNELLKINAGLFAPNPKTPPL